MLFIGQVLRFTQDADVAPLLYQGGAYRTLGAHAVESEGVRGIRFTQFDPATAATTRDMIEAHLDIDGLPVTVIDTAGLRDASDDLAVQALVVQPALASDDEISLRRALGEQALDLVAGRLKAIQQKGLRDEEGYPRVAVSFGGGGTLHTTDLVVIGQGPQLHAVGFGACGQNLGREGAV